MKTELSRKQFDILEILAEENQMLTQRLLADKSNHSLGTVNRVVKELTALGYMNDKGITQEGINALEPYRVKRAVFIAAGFGSRLVPVTLNTPKPLVRLNGKRIIDGLLDAVIVAGI